MKKLLITLSFATLIFSCKTKTSQPIDNTRYFCVGFKSENIIGVQNARTFDGKFISYDDAEGFIKCNYHLKNVTIISVFEFKDSSDFNSFFEPILIPNSGFMYDPKNKCEEETYNIDMQDSSVSIGHNLRPIRK